MIMPKSQFRSAFQPRERVVLETGEDTPVKQAMKDECDINRIMKRYNETGVITHGRIGEGRFEDVSDLGDYQEALEVVRRGKEVFEALPAAVRARFDNDPGEFVRFATDVSNIDEMIELGLLPPRRPPASGEPLEGADPIESAPTEE